MQTLRAAFAEWRFVRGCRKVLARLTEPVLIAADDGRIVAANPACSEALGYTVAEMCAMSTHELLGDADRTARLDGDVALTHKDGTKVAVDAIVLHSSTGVRLKCVLIRDIEERKAREARANLLMNELDTERRWLRGVLEHVPFAIVLQEHGGRISFNSHAEEILGTKLAPDGGAGQYIDHIRSADGRPLGNGHVLTSHALRAAQPVSDLQLLVERDDGSRVPVLVSTAPVLDAAGNAMGDITVLQDITASIREGEQLRASQRLLEGIFQILPVGLWIADKDARIVRGNPAATRIWAGARYVDPARFGEYRGWWLSTGKRIEPEEWALARALRLGETSIGELIRIQCFDGTFKTIINSALPLYDAGGAFAGAIAVNEDVTLLKEAEAELQRALASRDRMLSIVAHDLRSPLNVIQLRLQFLTQTSDRREDHIRALRTIQQQVSAMDRMIGDLLDVSAIEQGKLLLEVSMVACAPLIDDVVSAHDVLARNAGVRLRGEVHPGTPDILADRGRIVQVLNNLLGNALKFTREGGTVTVGARPATPAGTLLWVADTGVGIEPAFLDRVFDPLWQGRPDRRGVGLGLAIAKAIVEAHGGSIRVESTVDRGTAFFFTIPRPIDGRPDASDSHPAAAFPGHDPSSPPLHAAHPGNASRPAGSTE